MLNRFCNNVFYCAFYPVKYLLNIGKNSSKYILYRVLGFKKHESNRYDNDYLDDQYKNNELKNENGFLLV